MTSRSGAAVTRDIRSPPPTPPKKYIEVNEERRFGGGSITPRGTPRGDPTQRAGEIRVRAVRWGIRPPPTRGFFFFFSPLQPPPPRGAGPGMRSAPTREWLPGRRRGGAGPSGERGGAAINHGGQSPRPAPGLPGGAPPPPPPPPTPTPPPPVPVPVPAQMWWSRPVSHRRGGPLRRTPR